MGSSRKIFFVFLITLAFTFGSFSVHAATSQDAAPQTPPANTTGMVWVNTDTGVYHQPGTRYYGKTKHGKYMLEVDAVKAGYHPAGKTLSQ